MRIHVRCVQYDLLEGRKTILAEGSGELLNDMLAYEEKGTGFLHKVMFSDTCVVLKRGGDMPSVTTLVPGKRGKAAVSSAYGVMELETELEEMHKTEKQWMVTYRVISGEETASRMKLVWEMEEVSDE